jgi:membrane dipeptidase
MQTFDGHNDVLLRLGERDFLARSETGHLDLPRAREAGFAGGLFAAFAASPDFAPEADEEPDGSYEYPLPSALDLAYARERTLHLLARLHRLERRSEGAIRVCRSAADVTACLEDDTLAAVAHLEGAEAVGPDLDYLDLLYAAGVRSIGPVWSRPNAFGHGVPFAYPSSPDTGPGLTPEGRALVRACDDRGIMVDCAHLNEAGFWDVSEVSDAPLVSTHTGAHAVCESSRNLTDDQLRAVASSNGGVGTDVPVGVIADHVEYVADLVGVEHVALGSDFDGTSIPESVGDVTGLDGLYGELRERGFWESELEKVASRNWLRVLRETIG